MPKLKFLFNTGLLLVCFIGLLSEAKAHPLSLLVDTTSDGTYIINNKDELQILSIFVNDVGGIASTPPAWTSEGKTFILMNDIENFDMTIGTLDRPFMGTFDGNYKKISLSVPSYNYLETGVFGCTDGAIIKNLTSAGYIQHYDYSSTWAPIWYVGAIVCYGSSTTITNCTNLTDITIDCPGCYYVGGIAGLLENSTVTYCSNAGNITISGDESVSIGGIVGYIDNRYSDDLISNCVNIGTIKGLYALGGIAGGLNAANINNCVNAGWVSGVSEVGGIAGGFYELVSMEHCLNTGVVQGDNSVHSLLGTNYMGIPLAGKISNCYYDKQMSPQTGVQGSSDASIGVRGLTTNDLTKVGLLNANPDWSILPNVYSYGVWLMPFPPQNQVYSYPTIYASNGTISTLAAMPVRLSNNECWDHVQSSIKMDVGYWIYSSPQNSTFGHYTTFNWPEYGSVHWEAGLSGYLTVPPPATGTVSTFDGAYITSAGNPTGHSGISTLAACMSDHNGNTYKKTVPIRTTGVPFKIPVNEYEMYGFEASEVTPNIVTNNAVIDINTATEGNLNIAIFDVSGSEVIHVINKHVTAQSQTQVELNNLHNLPTGSYMVAVSVGNNVIFKKFIKQ